MNRTIMAIVFAALANLAGFNFALAQEPNPNRQGPGAGGGQNPILVALDENGDGELSAAEIDAASTALKAIDKNEDGKLSADEIRPRGRGVRSEGPGPGAGQAEGPSASGQGPGGPAGDPAQFAERLKQADTNGDGKISKDEAPERLQAMFDRIDENSDGFIGSEEVSKMAERFAGRGGRRGPGGPPEGAGPSPGGGFGAPEGLVDRLFQFDANGDGNLTREELAKMGEQFGGSRRGGETAEQGQRRRPQRPNDNN